MISNAGIVLLSSYFPMLFKKLGLLNKSGNDFKDIESKICAVFAIQYLSKKRMSDVSGIDFYLNGILVNYPYATALSTDYTFLQHEITVLDKFLRDVKMSWNRIQNTSIVAMQYTFFIRDGIIEEKEDKWILTVKPNPFDMLIKYVPFEFHNIKYPWMKKSIEVMW
jgi:hypothetical protein